MYSSCQASSFLPIIFSVHHQHIYCIFWQNQHDLPQTIFLYLYLILKFSYSTHQSLFSTLIPSNLAYFKAIFLPIHPIQLLWFNLTWVEDYPIHPHQLILLIQMSKPTTFCQACRKLTFLIILSSIFFFRDQWWLINDCLLYSSEAEVHSITSVSQLVHWKCLFRRVIGQILFDRSLSIGWCNQVSV